MQAHQFVMPVDIKILIQRIYLVEYESENDAACHDKDINIAIHICNKSMEMLSNENSSALQHDCKSILQVRNL